MEIKKKMVEIYIKPIIKKIAIFYYLNLLKSILVSKDIDLDFKGVTSLI
jgi:hypothetical protein